MAASGSRSTPVWCRRIRRASGTRGLQEVKPSSRRPPISPGYDFGIVNHSESMASTKVEEITSVLRDAIISGELPPGTLLRQDSLSEELGVSRTPVREAIRHLAAEGL